MGTTNGVEVSPDGKRLYVNESVQRNVVFDIQPDGGVANKRLLRQFPDHGFDGMRCDADGNLYITRYGKGTVAVLSPEGEVLREINVLGARPSNLCFGGPDGRTVYVTEVEHRRLVQFRVETPGAAGPVGNARRPAVQLDAVAIEVSDVNLERAIGPHAAFVVLLAQRLQVGFPRVHIVNQQCEMVTLGMRMQASRVRQ